MKSTTNKLRLAFIEAAIIKYDVVCRQDLQDMFNIGSACAGRDFRQYHLLYPDNIQYCLVERRYLRGQRFEKKALKSDTFEFFVHLNAIKDYF